MIEQSHSWHISGKDENSNSKSSYTSMFRAACSAVAKTRKQPRRYGTYRQWNITQP